MAFRRSGLDAGHDTRHDHPALPEGPPGLLSHALGGLPLGVLYRCAVVLAPREVYLCQLGPPERGGGHVRVLGTLPPGRAIDDVFDGWAEAHGAPDSLDWLLRRAAVLDGPAAGPQAGAGAGSASPSSVREASRLSRRPTSG